MLSLDHHLLLYVNEHDLAQQILPEMECVGQYQSHFLSW